MFASKVNIKKNQEFSTYFSVINQQELSFQEKKNKTFMQNLVAKVFHKITIKRISFCFSFSYALCYFNKYIFL